MVHPLIIVIMLGSAVALPNGPQHALFYKGSELAAPKALKTDKSCLLELVSVYFYCLL